MLSGLLGGVLTWNCSRRHVCCWRIRLNDDPDEDTNRFHLNSEAPLPSNYQSGRRDDIETEPCWTTSRNTIHPSREAHSSSAAAGHSPGSIKRKRGKELYLYMRPRRRSEEKNEKGIIEGRTAGSETRFSDARFPSRPHHTLALSSENPKLLRSFDTLVPFPSPVHMRRDCELYAPSSFMFSLFCLPFPLLTPIDFIACTVESTVVTTT